MTPTPRGRRPVQAYTARELRKLLVDDGKARYIGADDEWTYLAWFYEAVLRIAALEHLHPDVVLMSIDGEVFARTGLHLRVA